MTNASRRAILNQSCKRDVLSDRYNLVWVESLRWARQAAGNETLNIDDFADVMRYSPRQQNIH
jgi:hypothetical protein